MKQVKIKFLSTYTVQAKDGATYPEGSVHLLREDAAEHFTRRGLAEVCPADTPISEAPKVLEPVKPKPPEERDLTTTINLVSAFNRARMQAGVPDLKPSVPAPELAQQPEPEPPPPPMAAFEGNPLVSCVMPTWNRRPFIKAAIDCWLKQTYENKELIVLDDGDDKVRDLIPMKKGIRYIRLKERVSSTGMKRNKCCELAKGELICHFDDDDWSDPTRIERQVQLLRESGKPVAGYSNILYWNVLRDEARLYVASVKGYVCGGTMCYFKSWWEKHPFPDKVRASDNAVIYPNLKDIACSYELGMYVARAHSTNVGGEKKDVGTVTSKDNIPEAFWENEKLRTEAK